MSVVQIITLIVFCLAGALLGYQRWERQQEIPHESPQASEVSPEVVYPDGPDPAVVPPVQEK